MRENAYSSIIQISNKMLVSKYIIRWLESCVARAWVDFFGWECYKLFVTVQCVAFALLIISLYYTGNAMLMSCRGACMLHWRLNWCIIILWFTINSICVILCYHPLASSHLMFLFEKYGVSRIVEDLKDDYRACFNRAIVDCKNIWANINIIYIMVATTDSDLNVCVLRVMTSIM